MIHLPRQNESFTASTRVVEEGENTPPSTSGKYSSTREPGRPGMCTPEVVVALQSVIRELGLSDSAAAVRLGLGASTISRWKREDPELREHLDRAREECRALQLQRILQSAAAEHGRGWRAAAWLLERIFPEDYAPSAAARESHRRALERQAEQEEAKERATAHEAAWAERVRQAFAQEAEANVMPEEDAQATVASAVEWQGCAEVEPTVGGEQEQEEEEQEGSGRSEGEHERGARKRSAQPTLVRGENTSGGDCRNCRNEEAVAVLPREREVTVGSGPWWPGAPGKRVETEGC